MSILIKDKIAIVVDSNPFESQQSLKLAEKLTHHLVEAGHDAYVVKVPVDWHTGDTLMQSVLSLRLLKIMNADAVIAVDFPAAIVQHHNKYAWFTRTIEDNARLRYEETLATDDPAQVEEARQAPHRVTVIQDLVARIADSYLSECKRIIYCQNALTNDDAENGERENYFSDLTDVLKTALTKLTDSSNASEPERQAKLIVPGFENNKDKYENYLSALPWDTITKHFTRTLEIE